MTIDAALNKATRRLAAAGLDEPRREAASLLAFTLDKPHAFLIAHPDHVLAESERQAFDQAVARRESRDVTRET